MVEKIEMWKSEDGDLWDTENEAIKRDVMRTIVKSMDDYMVYGKLDRDAALEWIDTNYKFVCEQINRLH